VHTYFIYTDYVTLQYKENTPFIFGYLKSLLKFKRELAERVTAFKSEIPRLWISVNIPSGSHYNAPN
jgi:hypothetical protein